MHLSTQLWTSLLADPLDLLQAVIFIFEHSEQGSAGLILNRPTQYTIGGMPGLETLCPEFGDNVLFLVRTQPAWGRLHASTSLQGVHQWYQPVE